MSENKSEIAENSQEQNESVIDESAVQKTEPSETVKKPGLAICIFRVVFGLAFLFGLIFGCAGTLNWFSGWAFFAANIPLIVLSVPLMYKYNPEMLNRKFPKDTKRFDKIFMAIYIPLSHLVMVIGGLDERFDFSGDFADWVVLVSSTIYLIASLFWLWAVVSNRNFELTVRIQNDRGHKVCLSGPYKFMRHPAYVAGVLMFMAMPFALSTYWGLIPAVILTIALIIRTSLEDKTLINELEGYAEFTQKTKYKLIPGIW